MQTIALLIAALVGLSALMSFLAHLVKSAYKLTRRIEIIHDVVVRELVPNGGGALVDRVSAIEQRIGGGRRFDDAA